MFNGEHFAHRISMFNSVCDVHSFLQVGTALRQWTHKLLRLVNVKGRSTSLCVLGSAGISGVVKKNSLVRDGPLFCFIRLGVVVHTVDRKLGLIGFSGSNSSVKWHLMPKICNRFSVGP